MSQLNDIFISESTLWNIYSQVNLTSLSINQPNGTFIHEPTVLLLCSRVNFALTEVNNKHNVSHNMFMVINIIDGELQ